MGKKKKDLGSSFHAALEARYHVGPQFAEAYLDYWTREMGDRLESFEDVEKLPAPKPAWFDYAFSANQRGQEICRALRPALAPDARRFLHIGCEFGGALVAFAAQGFEVAGIPSDPQSLRFARANCADHQLEGCVFEPATLEEFQRQGRRFDLITCQSLIEQAIDPEQAMAQLTGLLADSGVLVLHIMNKDSMNFVTAAPTDGLFGLTLLGRAEAAEYHRHCAHGPYEGGSYQALAVYDEQARRHGCAVRLIETPLAAPPDLAGCGPRMQALLGAFQNFLAQPAERLPAWLAHKIPVLFRKYLAQLTQDLADATAGPEAVESFKQKYLADYWSLLIRKGMDMKD